MIVNNLGKIVFSFLFLCISSILNAKVLLQAPDTFYQGDSVVFKIIAAGSDIKIPEIKTIEGTSVANAGTSQNTTIVNSKRSFQIEKAYSLISNSDIHIPSFDILVDNKIEKTQAKTIKMKKVEKTKSDLYDLSISIDKNDVYVGEAIVFTLKFKYKKDLDIVGLNFNKPTFENFWVKELTPQKAQNNYTKYIEQEIKYLLFPQKAGKIELNPLKIIVSTVDNSSGRGYYFTSPTINTPVYSNKINLNVKELPSKVNLIGAFNINATVDKSIIDEGEAVSFKLYVKGRGNIDDLEEINLSIPNTTIYDNPSKKEYNIQNNIYGGEYSKTYSIVGKENFTIPSVEIRYFDKITQSVKTIITKEYEIQVNKKILKESKLEVATVPTKIIENKEKIVAVEISTNEKYFYFFIGFLSAIIIIGIYLLLKGKTKKKIETPLLKNVKKAKTPKEMFKILLVYINIDEELDKIIYKLETLPLEEYKKEKTNILKILGKKDIQLDK